MMHFSLDGLLMAVNDLRDKRPDLKLVKVTASGYGLDFEDKNGKIYHWSYATGWWKVKDK